MMGATDSTTSLRRIGWLAASEDIAVRMVFVTTTILHCDAAILSNDPLEKRPCVANAETERAPRAISSSVDRLIVAPVSTMSSTRMQSRPSTSPVSSWIFAPSRTIGRSIATDGALPSWYAPSCAAMASIPLGSPSTGSSAIAASSCSSRKASKTSTALGIVDACGATITGSRSPFFQKYRAQTGKYERVSNRQVGEKKPAVCSRKMSTVTTWSMHTSSSRMLTSAAEIGPRPPILIVCRE
mmetsp:Transcript_25498/g.58330  ORF Transcript_25498/g.58330 Transcript_25498/m.58330 type:complete len:241 (-) Transcript_25498:365-1087(-)